MREQRLRLRLAKLDAVRHISHLDLVRTLQRAMRRANLPVAYSEGFNPHPLISFASALFLGATSSAELLDVELEKRMPPGDFGRRLGRELPPGIQVLAAHEVPLDARSLTAGLAQAVYRVDLDVSGDDHTQAWQETVAAFLAQEQIEICRKTGKQGGVREVDLRPLIGRLTVASVAAGSLTLEMLLCTGSRGNARPTEVVAALSRYTDGKIAPEPRRVHRVELFFAAQGGPAPFRE